MMRASSSVALAAHSSPSSSSSSDEEDPLIAGINTASASLPREPSEVDLWHDVHRVSSSSSISISSSSSSYTYSLLFSLWTFPTKFCTSHMSSSFLLKSFVFLAVLFSPAFGEENWSLSCPQSLYFGALNHSATLQCGVIGVNLYEDVLFASIKWNKVRIIR